MTAIRFENFRSILCIGAHPDDIEIGCGSTLLKAFSDDTEVSWVVFSGDAPRDAEAASSARHWLNRFNRSQFECCDFEDGFFPAQWESIKRKMQEISSRMDPDLVFTHRLEDRHQDHRLLAEITWQVFRNQTILEYEVPKYEGDLGHPNFYVDLDREHLDQKTDWLLAHHHSQNAKRWFDRDTFFGLARLRGLECGSSYAEAFHARKLVVS